MFETLSADMRDAKTKLQEWAQSPDRGRGNAAPVYTLVGRDGPDHAPHFVSKPRSKVWARNAAKAAPSARPSRMLPPGCLPALTE